MLEKKNTEVFCHWEKNNQKTQIKHSFLWYVLWKIGWGKIVTLENSGLIITFHIWGFWSWQNSFLSECCRVSSTVVNVSVPLSDPSMIHYHGQHRTEEKRWGSLPPSTVSGRLVNASSQEKCPSHLTEHTIPDWKEPKRPQPLAPIS